MGAGSRCQLKLTGKKAPEVMALLVRRWGGFSVVALGPGLEHNRKPVALAAELSEGDVLGFGDVTYEFHTGHVDG